MDTILGKEKEKRGINKVFVVGILVGVVAIGAVLWVLSLRPPIEEQKAQILEGAYREGMPGFDELSKEIIISTDDRTVESPTAFGYISMYIHGKIRNKGTQTVDVLEVQVMVVDRFNQPLKEKRVLVVPQQQPELQPNETIPITLTLDGFNESDDRANIRWKVTAISAKE